MSAVEGEEILRFVLRQGCSQWFGETLASAVCATPPRVTTNQFAAACLSEREVDEEWPKNSAPCLFLTDDLCRIYEARPFACRLFLSTSRCQPDDAAAMPAAYPGVASAICQVIEHLGQRQYWGNMTDVLLALLARPEYEDIARFVAPDKITVARGRLLIAEPLPGFLLDDKETALAVPLIDAIFESQVSDKTVATLLDGG